MKNNIVLIGMPGVGKSSAGVILAKILGYKFLDAELVIQKTKGCLLKDIIANEGVDAFIKIENDINKSLVPEKTVIATGGSAVYGTEAMEHYKEIATIVYLKLDLKKLSRRLGNLNSRGVVLKDGQTLKDIYEERVPLYEKYADIIVDEKNKNIEQTIKAIVDQLD